MREIAVSAPFRRSLLFALCAWSFACLSAGAATIPVYIVNLDSDPYYAYSPATVTINVNDTVNWIWQSDYHSTTSEDGLWDSAVYNTGFTYPYTFTSAGNYNYYCSVHYFYGEVVVKAAASVPPTVTMTSPANGVILSSPATITLTATATNADGTSASVQFWQGATSLGTVAKAPYSVVVTNLPVGIYSFSAVATDDKSLTATNSISLQVVAPVAGPLATPQRASATSFQFTYSAAVGLSYVVDRAAVLPNWTPLSTNAAAAATVLFQDTNATGGASYYRVRQKPNP
ncbi:MAG TPA: Ig-like domain-containing protein [Candidatus Saccharimonadales bacterium]|nr:Ig-like domain-containing protein [Candidatus Saccharimonadales bacterium]